MDIMRSLLFVPLDSLKKIEKAKTLKPDALILDLEDGVGVQNKSQARRNLADQLSQFGESEASLLVRINGPQTPYFEEDLQIAVAPEVRGVILPKAEGDVEVAATVQILEQLEAEKGISSRIPLLLIVESASGVVHASALAHVSQRVSGLIFGAEDYCADMGIGRTESGEELSYARSVIVHAARSAQIEAIDTVYTRLEDETGLFDETRLIQRMGFTGKLLIHPKQISTVHGAFAPEKSELVWAEKIVQAFEAASQEGEGVVVVDGKMVDQPIVLQAIRILEYGSSAAARSQE